MLGCLTIACLMCSSSSEGRRFLVFGPSAGTMARTTVASLHNNFRNCDGEEHTSPGGPAITGWTYGQGCNVKMHCKACDKFSIRHLGLGTADFHAIGKESGWKCTRSGCGSNRVVLHGILFGGPSDSKPNSLKRLYFSIKGFVYCDADTMAVDEIDTGEDYKLLYHNEYWVFKETKEAYAYQDLNIHTWVGPCK